MAGAAIPYGHYEPSLLEPVYPQRTRHLEDLAVLLTSKAGQLTRGLHPILRSPEIKSTKFTQIICRNYLLYDVR